MGDITQNALLRGRAAHRDGADSGAAKSSTPSPTHARAGPRPSSPAAGFIGFLATAAIVIDENRTVSSVNAPFRTMFGLAQDDEIVGTSFAKLAQRLVIQGQEALLALGDSVTPSQGNFAENTRIALASGLVCEAQAVRLEDGSTVIVMSGTGFPATATRPLVSDEIEQSGLQALLDTIIDNVPLMISVRDAVEDRFAYVNKTFEAIVNRPRDEILNQQISFIFSEGQNSERRELNKRVIDEGIITEFPECVVDSPALGNRVLRTVKYPLIDSSRRVSHILSITEDITEQRKAEAALRRNEERLNDAIESFTDAIALFDANERLVFSNTRYETMLPRGDFAVRPGQTLESLVRAYAVEAARRGTAIEPDAFVRTRVEEFRRAPSVHELQLFNGTWLQITYRKTSEDGTVITITDITVLKEREEALKRTSVAALRAKEAAEIANKSKSEFLANMSHELRTPLNAVIGFSEIIRDALLGTNSFDEYRNYAKDIHDSGVHLLDLINDILDMSKIEAGKLDLVEGPLSLSEPIELAVRLVSERAQQNNVEVAVREAPGLPQIRGDIRKIKQIVINLLSNAVKFTPAGGSVTVSADRAENGDLLIAVKDTGIGIAKEDMTKVFQPFGQADTGLDRHFEGTGLGLNLARALTELHGGELTLVSATKGPNQGTTATIRFPSGRALD